jgi:hypothetical protein
LPRSITAGKNKIAAKVKVTAKQQQTQQLFPEAAALQSRQELIGPD